jgi:putative phage-type endonuclease
VKLPEPQPPYDIMPFAQGSASWRAWRDQGIGASDAPAILGVSPWTTRADLLAQKLGERPPDNNFAMRRGLALEPQIRAHCEKIFEPFAPVCLQNHRYPWLIASLDGLNFDADLGLEIKCPNKKFHTQALDGILPHHYVPQLQHTFATCPSLKRIIYVSFGHEASFPDPSQRYAFVQVLPRFDWIDNVLWPAELLFWQEWQDAKDQP